MLRTQFGLASSVFDNMPLYALTKQALQVLPGERRPVTRVTPNYEYRLITFKLLEGIRAKVDVMSLASRLPSKALQPDVCVHLLAMRTVKGAEPVYLVDQMGDRHLVPLKRSWVNIGAIGEGYLTSPKPAEVQAFIAAGYTAGLPVNTYRHPPSIGTLPVALAYHRMRFRQLRSGAVEIRLTTRELLWETDSSISITKWTSALAKEAREAALQQEYPSTTAQASSFNVEAQASDSGEEKRSVEAKPQTASKRPVIGEAVSFNKFLYEAEAEAQGTFDCEKRNIIDADDPGNNLFVISSSVAQTVKLAITVEGRFSRLDLQELIELPQTLRFL
jgi:hypothetical protein